MVIGNIVLKTAKKKKEGKKNRKYGWNIAKCAQYRSEGRREKNKARKLAKIERERNKKNAKREAKASREVSNGLHRRAEKDLTQCL